MREQKRGRRKNKQALSFSLSYLALAFSGTKSKTLGLVTNLYASIGGEEEKEEEAKAVVVVVVAAAEAATAAAAEAAAAAAARALSALCDLPPPPAAAAAAKRASLSLAGSSRSLVGSTRQPSTISSVPIRRDCFF